VDSTCWHVPPFHWPRNFHSRIATLKSNCLSFEIKWSDPIGYRIPSVCFIAGHRFFPPSIPSPPPLHHNSIFLLLLTRPSPFQLIIMPRYQLSRYTIRGKPFSEAGNSLIDTDVRGRPMVYPPFPDVGIPCTCEPEDGCRDCHGGSDPACLAYARRMGFRTTEDYINFCETDDVILPCQQRLGNMTRCWNCRFCAYDLCFADWEDMNEFKRIEGPVEFEWVKNSVDPDGTSRYPMQWPYNVISDEDKRVLFPYLFR
jgi:hypothetical protein